MQHSVPALLLVTGSRTLVDIKGAVEWAQGLINRAIDDEGAKLVVAGDAGGPDFWGLSLAHNRGLHISTWSVHGSLAGTHYDSWTTHDVPWATTEELRNTAPERIPLLRNQRMVQWVSEQARKKERRAVCLALIDPASPTKGTQHTARLALEAGLDLVVRHYTGGSRS